MRVHVIMSNAINERYHVRILIFCIATSTFCLLCPTYKYNICMKNILKIRFILHCKLKLYVCVCVCFVYCCFCASLCCPKRFIGVYLFLCCYLIFFIFDFFLFFFNIPIQSSRTCKTDEET